MCMMKTAIKEPYSMPKKPRQRRQSRKLSNRHFRIGSGKIRHEGADWCGITTTHSIPSALVSMTEAILYLAVSAQRLLSDLTRSMLLPISCTAATHSLPIRWAQERPLKWLLRHRKASALDYAISRCSLFPIILWGNGLPSISGCTQVPISL